jgi:hypothetical protein
MDGWNERGEGSCALLAARFTLHAARNIGGGSALDEWEKVAVCSCRVRKRLQVENFPGKIFSKIGTPRSALR